MVEPVDGPSAAFGLIPDLPDDLSVRCIARVPRSLHPYLALVSRSWRSLLTSPLLSTVRTELGLTDPALCLSIRSPSGQSLWYLLHPLHGHRHHPRPAVVLLPPPALATAGSACASLGPRLFVLGGTVNGITSSAVQILDARKQSWSLGPRMTAARQCAAAAALDGLIYAVGGCLPPPDAWTEALDPESGRWTVIPSPPHVREKWMHGCVVLGGKILAMKDHGGVALDPAATELDEMWGSVPSRLDNGWRGRAVVVDGIIYSYDFLGKIKGHDPEFNRWKQVEGVEKKLPKFLCGATLANLAGLLCLVWEGKRTEGDKSKEMAIEWAGIEVSKRADGGLQGSVVWSEPVLAVQKGSMIAHCVALEL